jgi:16S rRNA (cytosine967-C5)-methyltransferase
MTSPAASTPSHAPSPRLLAANLVNAVLLEGLSLTTSLANLRASRGLFTKAKANSTADIDGRELAAAQNLAYGVLREAGRLRFFLAQLTQRPVQPDALTGHLLVGLHELDAGLSPAYAAVNETVDVAARRYPHARAFVNAVLRNFQRQRETLEQAARRNPEALWNFPNWWLQRLQTEYPSNWQDIVRQLNARPPMTLRVNLRRITRDDFCAQLTAAGIEYRLPDGDPAGAAVILKIPLPVAELPGFAAGLVSVQDLGAQWAAPLLDVAAGMRVLDACAAPGGKTGHLLETANLDLLALDSDAGRLGRVRENLDRLGLSNQPGSTVRLLAEDAGNPERWWDRKPFDRILLDAPCTASGVVRRHPDGKWLKRAEDMQHLAREQAGLMEALWPLLQPGGKMLYATCSLFKAENSEQISTFLARHADARIEPVASASPGETPLMPTTLLPSEDMDGFFYARLLKT